MVFLSVFQVSHDFAINFNPEDDECEGKTNTRPSSVRFWDIFFILEKVHVQDGQITTMIIIQQLPRGGK